MGEVQCLGASNIPWGELKGNVYRSSAYRAYQMMNADDAQ